MGKILKQGDFCLLHCVKSGHGWRLGWVVGPGFSTLSKINGQWIAHVGCKVQAGDGCFDVGTIITGSSFVTDQGLAVATSDSVVASTRPGIEFIDQGYFPYLDSYSDVYNIE